MPRRMQVVCKPAILNSHSVKEIFNWRCARMRKLLALTLALAAIFGYATIIVLLDTTDVSLLLGKNNALIIEMHAFVHAMLIIIVIPRL
jgi:hypothetical protein